MDVLQDLPFSVSVTSVEPSKNRLKDLRSSNGSSLRVAVQKTLIHIREKYGGITDASTAKILAQIPNRYYVYGPLLLLSSGSFEGINAWTKLADNNLSFSKDFYSILCSYMKSTHVALNAPISGDNENVMRKPTSLVCLYGDFGRDINESSIANPDSAHFSSELWAVTRQNGIQQTWAPRYTMFSRGNIKEKSRVIKFENVKNKTIVDLYAGIGYFTFSYAYAGALRVICWEINPWSVEGLLRGARANRLSTQLVRHDEEWIISDDLTGIPQIIVFLESNIYAIDRLRDAENRYGFTYDLAHVNMGLLPSSEQSWSTAVQLSLNSTSNSTMLHVHANVKDEEIPMWARSTRKTLQSMGEQFTEPVLVQSCHLARIKSFAPGVMHICGDFQIEHS